MAEKRMFSKTIIDSDAFLDMPLSAQSLYFHLSMRADDDGFINNPKKIQRMVGASDDDARLLVIKKFIIPFDSGVVVIKHWKIHNYIRKDTYKETQYLEEKSMLGTKENKSYTLLDEQRGRPVDVSVTQNRIDKISIDKIREDKVSKDKETYISIISDFTSNDELKKSLLDFVEMRKKMKGFTTRALKLALNELNKLAIDDYTKIDIVNRSVMNSWKSFYQLQTNKNKKEEMPF